MFNNVIKTKTSLLPKFIITKVVGHGGEIILTTKVIVEITKVIVLNALQNQQIFTGNKNR